MIRIGRRSFVHSAALAAVAAPFLTLFRADSYAGGSTHARRIVFFFTPNDTIHRFWRPAVSGATFTFPAGSILEPLTPIKRHLVVLDGIDFRNTSNHEGSMAAMLTGAGGAGTATMGTSVDQYLARAVGSSIHLASLELGVQTSAWGGNAQTRMSYASAGRYVPPDDDPASVYRRLFAGMMPTPGMIDPLMARRRSVLDLVRGELRELQGRVGAEESRKLDAHLEALRRVETSLTGPSTSRPATTCTPPAVMALDPAQNDNFPAVGRMQMQLLLAAPLLRSHEGRFDPVGPHRGAAGVHLARPARRAPCAVSHERWQRFGRGGFRTRRTVVRRAVCVARHPDGHAPRTWRRGHFARPLARGVGEGDG